MQTIFAIDGSEFGAASQDVATLQNALVALGKGIGDTSLSKLTIDGLIGPKTTAATNRAFTVHLGSGQAPASYRTGAMSQAQVETSANTLAAYIETELVRRGFSAPPVKIVAPAKKATTSTTKTAAAVPTATYLPTTALKPAVYLPPDASDGPSQGTQIVKWSAIGLGAVVVAGLAYYLIKKRAPSVMADFEILDGDGERYKTFIRSASASQWGRKRTVDTGLTYDEARRACQNYNASRSSREIKRGTKMEFTQD